MQSSNDNPSDRSSFDKSPVLPDISGICAKAREENDTARAFAMLDEMCMVALQDDTHVKAISPKDAHEIVESFEALGVNRTKAGRNADAALCYAVTARVATFFPDLEAKVGPALNRALEYSDFIDIKKDERLAVEIAFVYQFPAKIRPSFDFRNEPERMKFYEAGLASSIIRTERAGEPPVPRDVKRLIDACMTAGQMHEEAKRFENAAYWFKQGAHLAEKISYRDQEFSLWCKAGSCSDESGENNRAEKVRCFLNALKLLPSTRTPDSNTDEMTFEERHEALLEMGLFFFGERLIAVNPNLREKGVACLLQALDDLRQAGREKDFDPDAALMRSRLGTFYRETNQLDLAQTYLREAVTTWKRGIPHTWKNDASQQTQDVREVLAEMLNQLGDVLEKQAGKEQTGTRERTLQDAQDSFKEARELYRELFLATPSLNKVAHAAFHDRTQTMARNEARAARSLEHWDDAVKILERAVQFEKQLMIKKVLQHEYETIDGINQDLGRARSELKKNAAEHSQTINDVSPKKQESRKIQ